MAFENINVASLKYSLNSCKNSINRSISDNLSNSIINDSIWYCNARNNLKKAIDKNLDLYSSLESKIDQFLQVANKIEEYKNLEVINKNLQNEYQSLQGKLWVEEEYTRRFYNKETKKWDWEEETRTVKDVNVENSMNQIQNEINNNIQRMSSLENSIKNMV